MLGLCAWLGVGAVKKRYNQFNSHLMAECIDGDYVLFSEAVEIEQERDQLKARVEELENAMRDYVDAAMCRRMFIQEIGMGSRYVDWRQAKGIEGEKYK